MARQRTLLDFHFLTTHVHVHGEANQIISGNNNNSNYGPTASPSPSLPTTNAPSAAPPPHLFTTSFKKWIIAFNRVVHAKPLPVPHSSLEYCALPRFTKDQIQVEADGVPYFAIFEPAPRSSLLLLVDKDFHPHEVLTPTEANAAYFQRLHPIVGIDDKYDDDPPSDRDQEAQPAEGIAEDDIAQPGSTTTADPAPTEEESSSLDDSTAKVEGVLQLWSLEPPEEARLLTPAIINKFHTHQGIQLAIDLCPVPRPAWISRFTLEVARSVLRCFNSPFEFVSRLVHKHAALSPKVQVTRPRKPRIMDRFERTGGTVLVRAKISTDSRLAAERTRSRLRTAKTVIRVPHFRTERTVPSGGCACGIPQREVYSKHKAWRCPCGRFTSAP